MDTASHRSTAHPRSASKGLSSRLAQLSVPDGASPDELRREWRRLYHSDPPRISRDLLIRGIGYRLQEIKHGGLGKATRRKTIKNVPPSPEEAAVVFCCAKARI